MTKIKFVFILSFFVIQIFSPSSRASEALCSEVFYFQEPLPDLDKLDNMLMQLGAALADPQLNLKFTDYFATGPKGSNLVRNLKENKMEVHPQDLGELILSDEDYLNSKLKPALIIPNALRVELNFALFKNDIYRNGYFATVHNDSSFAEKDWLSLIKNQPWLRWDEKIGKFVPSFKEAQNNLIKKIILLADTNNQGNLTLYRGTFRGESHLLKTIQLLLKTDLSDAYTEATLTMKYLRTKGALAKILTEFINLKKQTSVDSDLWKDRLIEAYQKELMQTPDLDLLFTTLDLSKAHVFAKGSILQFDFSSRELSQLNSEKTIYIGVEDHIEMAFHSTKGIESLAKALSASTEEALPQDGGLFKSGAQHPLWLK